MPETQAMNFAHKNLPRRCEEASRNDQTPSPDLALNARTARVDVVSASLGILVPSRITAVDMPQVGTHQALRIPSFAEQITPTRCDYGVWGRAQLFTAYIAECVTLRDGNQLRHNHHIDIWKLMLADHAEWSDNLKSHNFTRIFLIRCRSHLARLDAVEREHTYVHPLSEVYDPFAFPSDFNKAKALLSDIKQSKYMVGEWIQEALSAHDEYVRDLFRHEFAVLSAQKGTDRQQNASKHLVSLREDLSLYRFISEDTRNEAAACIRELAIQLRVAATDGLLEQEPVAATQAAVSVRTEAPAPRSGPTSPRRWQSKLLGHTPPDLGQASVPVASEPTQNNYGKRCISGVYLGIAACLARVWRGGISIVLRCCGYQSQFAITLRLRALAAQVDQLPPARSTRWSAQFVLRNRKENIEKQKDLIRIGNYLQSLAGKIMIPRQEERHALYENVMALRINLCNSLEKLGRSRPDKWEDYFDNAIQCIYGASLTLEGHLNGLAALEKEIDVFSSSYLNPI